MKKKKELLEREVVFLSLTPASHRAGGPLRSRRKKNKQTMPRKLADRPLKVNPRRGPGGGQLACADELAAFLACMMVRREGARRNKNLSLDRRRRRAGAGRRHRPRPHLPSLSLIPPFPSSLSSLPLSPQHNNNNNRPAGAWTRKARARAPAAPWTRVRPPRPLVPNSGRLSTTTSSASPAR